MFTPKTNSKHKCAKKTQERKTGGAVSVQLAVATRQASSHRKNSPLARLQLAVASCDSDQQLCSREKPQFCPKIPIFDSPMPKLVPKV